MNGPDKDEMKRMVKDALQEILSENNPHGYVTAAKCKAQYGWLIKLVIGLYGIYFVALYGVFK